MNGPILKSVTGGEEWEDLESPLRESIMKVAPLESQSSHMTYNWSTTGPMESRSDSGSVALSSEHSMEGFGSVGDGSCIFGGLAQYFAPVEPEEERVPSLSLNVTDSVSVPTSEHVAEIVGRQGCKIKALRAKTNTYIKTPVRDEDSVFVITGRKDDVAEAKREIANAAEHFTQLRASRRHSHGSQPAPGHVTDFVHVPYRVVGLVVGPKGGTIKRIQQITHTYIITPSRDKEPVFEITGIPTNVAAARAEIEEHIFSRTGHMGIACDPRNTYMMRQQMLANDILMDLRNSESSDDESGCRSPVFHDPVPSYGWMRSPWSIEEVAGSAKGGGTTTACGFGLASYPIWSEAGAGYALF